jgi:NADH-quinone oxidoreductase subunit G
MCDEGRFGWKYIHSESRLRVAEQREAGKVVARGWNAVLPAVRSAFAQVARAGGRLAGILSPWMTVEEAYLLATFLRTLGPDSLLALGPVDVIGEDDCYPKDVHGRPRQPTRFTIRAEKCPNRRGVQAVLAHFSQNVLPFGDMLGMIASQGVDAAYLVGGDPRGWIDDEQAAALAGAKVVAVQDLFPSPASDRASFVLAGGAFAEREGTFVNHAGLAQEIPRAIRGPGDARPDGRILWELCGRPGLFRAAAVREEIAAVIPAFACFQEGRLGEQGMLLNRKPEGVERS